MWGRGTGQQAQGRGLGEEDKGQGTSGQGTWGRRHGEEDVGKVTQGRAGGAAGGAGVEFPPQQGKWAEQPEEVCGHAVGVQNWDHPSEDLGFSLHGLTPVVFAGSVDTLSPRGCGLGGGRGVWEPCEQPSS